MSELDLDELTLWAKAAPDSGVLLHVSDALALIAAARENTRLRAELSAANGYLLNAKIDLETGAPKRTALATIEGGLRRVRAALNLLHEEETDAPVEAVP